MPNIPISWNPPGTNSGVDEQIISTRKRGDTTWITSDFNPSNNLLPNVGSATYQNATGNTVYQFKLNNVCASGTSLDSVVKEGINFECFSFVAITRNETSISILTDEIPEDITQIVYLLSTNGVTVISTSPAKVPSGNTTNHTFTGLTPNTTYYINTQAQAFLDTQEVYSNFANCQNMTSTLVGGGGTGRNITLNNYSSNFINSMSPAYAGMSFPMSPGAGQQESTGSGTVVFQFVIGNQDSIPTNYTGVLRKNGSVVQTISGGITANGTSSANFNNVTFSQTAPIDVIDIVFT